MRFIELNIVNDFLDGNVFEHFKEAFLMDNVGDKCFGDIESIFKKMLVYVNYMKVVTEDIALMCPVPKTFKLRDSEKNKFLPYLVNLLDDISWEQEFSSIIRDLETKGDVFYQVYEKDGVHYYEKLDTLLMKEIHYEDNKPKYYIYECDDMDTSFDEKTGQMSTKSYTKRFVFTNGGYYLLENEVNDDGVVNTTPIFYQNSELMGDMIPIIHIKSIEKREGSQFSKIPAVDYIDPILYLMAVDTDRRATNRYAGFPRIFVINGEIDENSSFDPGGVVFVNSLKDYTIPVQPEISVKAVEITNSLSSIKQELEYMSDWLHRSVGLIPPSLQLKMSSSDSSKAIAQFRIKQEVKNRKYIQNVRDSFSDFFLLKLKEEFKKKVKLTTVHLEVPKLLTTTSAFDSNLLISQEMAMGMTTVANELAKAGYDEQEIKTHLDKVNNEIFQASGKDVSTVQSDSQTNNNLSTTEVTQVDNKLKK